MQRSIVPMRQFPSMLIGLYLCPSQTHSGGATVHVIVIHIVCKRLWPLLVCGKAMTPADVSFSQRTEGEDQWSLSSFIAKCKLDKAFHVLPKTEITSKGLIQRTVDRGGIHSQAKTWGSYSSNIQMKDQEPMFLFFCYIPRVQEYTVKCVCSLCCQESDCDTKHGEWTRSVFLSVL